MGRPSRRPPPPLEHGGRDSLQAAEQPPGAAEQDRGAPGRRHGRTAYPQGGRSDHGQRGQVVPAAGARRGRGATRAARIPPAPGCGGRGGRQPWLSPRGGVHGSRVPRPVVPCQPVLVAGIPSLEFPPVGSSSLDPPPRLSGPRPQYVLRTSPVPTPGHCAPPARDPHPRRAPPVRDPPTVCSSSPGPPPPSTLLCPELEPSSPRSVPSRLLWEPGLASGSRGTGCQGTLSFDKPPGASALFCPTLGFTPLFGAHRVSRSVTFPQLLEPSELLFTKQCLFVFP